MDDKIRNLWAPWRLSYVTAPKKPSTADGCFICNGLSQQKDRENHIVLRTDFSVVVLNRFPYNNGHLLVAPKSHKGHIAELTGEEGQDIMAILSRMVGILDGLMHPDGYNIGLNMGKAAGAGLPGHLHWHIVPRWNGDTNFMPVIGDIKVIVQSLDTLYDLLAEQLAKTAS